MTDLLTIDLDPDVCAPPTLPCLATPAPFRAWLTAQAPTETVGRRRASGSCPLACFLQAQGYAAPMVDDGFFTTGLTPDASVVAMPAWAGAFVRGIDAGSRALRIVTAAEALEALEAYAAMAERYPDEEESYVP